MGAPPILPNAGSRLITPASTMLGRVLRLTAMGAAVLSFALLDIPLCPVAAVAHQPCPGCGLTRATLALVRGRVAEAMGFQPLAPLVCPLVIGFLGYEALAYVRSGRVRVLHGAAARRLMAVGLVLWGLLVAVWVARFCGAFGGPVAV